jgi:hypothetical protein
MGLRGPGVGRRFAGTDHGVENVLTHGGLRVWAK